MKKVKEIPTYKYFVSSVDTKLGHCICDLIKNDFTGDKPPHTIQGTKSINGQGQVPSSVKKVINNSDINVLTKTLMDSDIIIYDMNTSKFDEIEYAIKALKMGSYTGDKYFILISSVMVWSDSPPKEKEEGEEEDDDTPEEGEEEEEEKEPEPEPTGEEEEEKKVYVSYKEADYPKRRPLPQYEIFKSIETLCLSAGKSKPNLLTYVLCAGVQYGHGEQVFAEYFKQAWLQNPTELAYIGDGKNLVPTIHVRDLAMFTQFIVKKKPQKRYIFAIDHTKKPALKKHVETISKGLGTGKVKSVENMEDQYLDIFKLNIKLKPSTVIEEVEAKEEEDAQNNPEEEEEEEAEEEEEGGEGAIDKPPKIRIPKFNFVWWCKEGMRKHIAKLVEEYNTHRGLKPIKIFITGPPASGKTFYGSRLSVHYNIPLIRVQDIVKEGKELALVEGDELGGEIASFIQEEKDRIASENEEKLEAWKAKKKGPKPITDPEKIDPRLSDELLYKLYKRRLARNDCFNRGFVMDGYPKSYENVKGIFLTLPPAADGEEPDEEAPKVLDQRKAPQFVIQLVASDDFLKERIRALPEEFVSGTHYNEEGMDRRLKKYHVDNYSEAGNPVLMDFFKEHKIESIRLNTETSLTEDAFKTMRAFVEKHGKFENYQRFEENEEAQRIAQIEATHQKQLEKNEQIRKERDEKEGEERKLQEEKSRLKSEALKEQEKMLLEERSRPLRTYLLSNVVPFLTTGLVEICKQRPEDPVDFLAQYLFKKSLDVKNPDPGHVRVSIDKEGGF